MTGCTDTTNTHEHCHDHHSHDHHSHGDAGTGEKLVLWLWQSVIDRPHARDANGTVIHQYPDSLLPPLSTRPLNMPEKLASLTLILALCGLTFAPPLLAAQELNLAPHTHESPKTRKETPVTPILSATPQTSTPQTTPSPGGSSAPCCPHGNAVAVLPTQDSKPAKRNRRYTSMPGKFRVIPN